MMRGHGVMLLWIMCIYSLTHSLISLSTTTAHADDDEDEAAPIKKKKKKKAKKAVAAKPREEVVKNVDLSTAILGGSSARNSMQVRRLLRAFGASNHGIDYLEFHWEDVH
jgi:hypothetical protein